MLVVDGEKSEKGPQRRRANSGRALHCCCICGKLDVWGNSWAAYYSIKELDDGEPIPKFCSEKCRGCGGVAAENITDEMKQKARDAEWRDPEIAWREATAREKYLDAAHKQKRSRIDDVNK